ncbi:MAG TPA: hypothetical protein VFS10_03545 [Pyrinomonadaceae bacterium]|nr:hypothetical protein [Pyrinomonadaceae bacterium]
MNQRILTFIFATSLSLSAAHTALAGEIEFQSATAQSGTQSAGGQTPQSGGPTVQNVELGDVTGTVCDCGEIAPAPAATGAGEGGGFPKFPLLALAVLGLPPPPPSDPRPPSPVPEPVTLATLAAALAALAAVRNRRV